MTAAVLYAQPDDATKIYRWEALTEADQGASIQIPPAYSDKTVIATGTFNGGAYSLEVSVDNVNWVAANDVQGDAISFSSAGAVGVIGPNGWYYRVVNDTNGSSEDVDISLTCVLR